jgi:hypothetical protein
MWSFFLSSGDFPSLMYKNSFRMVAFILEGKVEENRFVVFYNVNPGRPEDHSSFLCKL